MWGGDNGRPTFTSHPASGVCPVYGMLSVRGPSKSAPRGTGFWKCGWSTYVKHAHPEQQQHRGNTWQLGVLVAHTLNSRTWEVERGFPGQPGLQGKVISKKQQQAVERGLGG